MASDWPVNPWHSKLLCDAMLEWEQRQSSRGAAAVAAAAGGPGRTDWPQIAAMLNEKLRTCGGSGGGERGASKVYSGLQCRKQWRFLAYGELPQGSTITADTEDSDDEADFFLYPLQMLEAFGAAHREDGRSSSSSSSSSGKQRLLGRPTQRQQPWSALEMTHEPTVTSIAVTHPLFLLGRCAEISAYRAQPVASTSRAPQAPSVRMVNAAPPPETSAGAGAAAATAAASTAAAAASSADAAASAAAAAGSRPVQYRVANELWELGGQVGFMVDQGPPVASKAAAVAAATALTAQKRTWQPENAPGEDKRPKVDATMN